jgi:acyl-coenzyme A thioesterase PaaI-like protein
MRSGLAAMGHLITWPGPADTGSVVVDRYRRDRWHRRLASKTVRPFDLLVDYGIAVPASIPVRSRTEALAAAAEIGYPVAMKTVGAAHKSEVGGVALGVADAAALTAAYDDMSARLGPDVSVDAMVPAGVEVSVGFVRDAAFGPLVVVAAGGVAVELHGDRAVVCPPVTRAAARLRLGELRMAPLLTGWRGGPPVDVEALVEVIVGFSSMATELGDAVDAVEANPVIVSPTGAIAVDALVVPSSAPG